MLLILKLTPVSHLATVVSIAVRGAYDQMHPCITESIFYTTKIDIKIE